MNYLKIRKSNVRFLPETVETTKIESLLKYIDPAVSSYKSHRGNLRPMSVYALMYVEPLMCGLMGFLLSRFETFTSMKFFGILALILTVASVADIAMFGFWASHPFLNVLLHTAFLTIAYAGFDMGAAYWS